MQKQCLGFELIILITFVKVLFSQFLICFAEVIMVSKILIDYRLIFIPKLNQILFI